MSRHWFAINALFTMIIEDPRRVSAPFTAQIRNTPRPEP